MRAQSSQSTLRILAKVSLLLFGVLLVASIPQLAVPGKRWPSYALAACFTLLPLAVGPRWLRSVAAIGLLLSGILILGDIQAGKRYHERMERIAHDYQKPP